MSKKSAKSKKRGKVPKKHEFASLGEFDRAMRHIVTVPKEQVDTKKQRTKKKK